MKKSVNIIKRTIVEKEVNSLFFAIHNVLFLFIVFLEVIKMYTELSCIVQSLKEVIFNLNEGSVIEINQMIDDLKEELEEVGKCWMKVDEENGLLIRDTVDELDNYVDSANLFQIQKGVNECINDLNTILMK